MNRVSLFLDGDFFCGIPESLLSILDLYPGKEVDEQYIARIIDAKLTQEAKAKVIRLLNRRIYSENEIVDKLKRKQYDEHIIAAVVAELKKLSFIDDLAFARAFVSDRIRLNPSGSFKIAYELRQKGISKKVINQVLQEEKVAEGDGERALAVARKRLATFSANMDTKTKRRRLANYLKRRGFSFEVISNTLQALLNERT